MDEKQQMPLIVAAATIRMKVLLAHQANYSRTKRMKIDNIVIHATHGAEGANKDYDAAFEISKPLPKGKERSFHYVVDSDSATRCVPDVYVAWHARRTANARSIGVELCGSADQTRSQWTDAVSMATLEIAARLVADLCKTHNIPTVLCRPQDLVADQRGITTHQFCSQAWKQSDHYDPGPNFPLIEFVEAVANAAATIKP